MEGRIRPVFKTTVTILKMISNIHICVKVKFLNRWFDWWKILIFVAFATTTGEAKLFTDYRGTKGKKWQFGGCHSMYSRPPKDFFNKLREKLRGVKKCTFLHVVTAGTMDFLWNLSALWNLLNFFFFFFKWLDCFKKQFLNVRHALAHFYKPLQHTQIVK